MSVKEIIDSLDERGAWVEEGSIGKDNRVVSVFAAKDMVVKIGDQTLPLNENQTLQIFEGKEAPREQVIRTRTFARNMEALMSWLRSNRQ